MRELFEGIIFRDVVYCYGFRDVRFVKFVVELVLSWFFFLVSVLRLRNEVLGIVGRKVLLNFVDFVFDVMEEVYFIYRVLIFLLKVKDVRRYLKKFYVVDIGLVNVMIMWFIENIGRLVENVVVRYFV